jgi:hypothetical protein
MFVVKTLTDDPVYKAFGNMGAAQRWAEDDACLKHHAQQCQIYRTVGGLTQRQAIAAVRLGKAERLQTVFRKFDPDATQERQTAVAVAPRAQGESDDA